MAARLRRMLLRLEAVVASASLLALLLMALVQFLARNVFETGFPVLEVISRHLVLFVIFFGAGLATEEARHIRIDVLANLLPPRVRRGLRVPLLLMGALLCAALAGYAGLFWREEWQYAPVNERLAMGMAAVVPIGFAVLALHFLLLVPAGDDGEKP